jgi:uncharacterized membrane protein
MQNLAFQSITSINIPGGCGTTLAVLGIILIIAGLAMVIIRGFSVQTEKKVLDVGPVEVNKKENRWVGWPTYAGGIVAVVGVVLVLSGNKRR